MKTTEQFVERFKNNENLLIRCCEILVLRPNDDIKFGGIERHNNKQSAVEEILNTEKYINSELRKYYYEMKNNNHNFNNFERWKTWGIK